MALLSFSEALSLYVSVVARAKKHYLFMRLHEVSIEMFELYFALTA